MSRSAWFYTFSRSLRAYISMRCLIAIFIHIEQLPGTSHMMLGLIIYGSLSAIKKAVESLRLEPQKIFFRSRIVKYLEQTVYL